jgi:hypothetical protein
MDEIISLFIDDEMTVDQKIVFVKQVHGDAAFTRLTLDLLCQESLLRAVPCVPGPAVVLPAPRRPAFPFRFRWAAPFAAGLAAALLLVFLWLPGGREKQISHRFVIYQPEARSVAVTGTFTDWRAAPMERAGQSGYWEVVLDIPAGEHRFSYILDGSQQMPDPTIPIREPDDFGGVNSILNVEVSV